MHPVSCGARNSARELEKDLFELIELNLNSFPSRYINYGAVSPLNEIQLRTFTACRGALLAGINGVKFMNFRLKLCFERRHDSIEL